MIINRLITPIHFLHSLDRNSAAIQSPPLQILLCQPFIFKVKKNLNRLIAPILFLYLTTSNLNSIAIPSPHLQIPNHKVKINFNCMIAHIIFSI
ncbi:hypothetical protein KFK09_002235 [Dendrobium nobile]|uniref:Uncharacterized protein n=1 Tax=Dendrobium nobile TaxID=94219 RepID=A0A8T3CCE3_DENNO|nr:hypothetical protein KFK09_002235 [Dendrobium nobile]